MNIPFLSRNKSSDKRYLGLFLKEKEGIGMSIILKNGVLTLEDYEKFTYSNGWENICEDVDEMLIKLEKKVNVHFKETIFFVYSHFIDQGSKQIKKEYLGVIKTLVKSIELSALGYIEVYEAIAKFLEERDEAPLTAILTELDVNHSGVFVYKGGKVVFMKTIPKTENLITDLENTFLELKGQVLLPSRIVLYNSHLSDDISTKIMTHHWKDDFFIQLPRVEIINESDILKSLVHIFEEQIIGEKIQKTHTEEAPELMEEPEEANVEMVEEEDKEVMGFVVGKDVVDEESVEETPISEPKKKFELSTVFTILTSPFKRFSNAIISHTSKTPVILYLVIGLVIILVSLFINEYFFHKAVLKVYLPTQSLSSHLVVSSLEINPSTQSASFTQNSPVTGVREVGDSAKGEVTLYNLEDSVKTLKAGTTLQTNNLSYTLNSDTDLPAATVDSASNASVPGKTKAKITAATIGPESNLEKGKRFKIADLSATIYYGINEAAITGGVKKEVQTVAKKDIDALKTKIQDAAKVKQTTTSNSNDGMSVISPLTETALTNVKSTANVGDAAETVGVSADVVTTSYLYNQKEMLRLLTENFKGKIPNGEVLKNENIHYTIDSVDTKSGTTKLTVSVNAKATKDVSPSEITSKILFKDKKGVEQILKSDYKAEGFELSNKEPFIVFSSFLPFFKQNITVEVSSL